MPEKKTKVGSIRGVFTHSLEGGTHWGCPPSIILKDVRVNEVVRRVFPRVALGVREVKIANMNTGTGAGNILLGKYYILAGPADVVLHVFVDPGNTFDSDPGSVLDSDFFPAFNSDSATNHSSDLKEAGG
ncbi:hypothetical protein EVAR_47061_1 [Eumeta japonica]|uniref:Uncharacterized protein n=1 Tax=Eumeta variegata TaxID=151549 RepID=A0A4C1WP38_EUMVA|nr:hypothetical protein EVAR_47061_1 [Eumeta japonica]